MRTDINELIEKYEDALACAEDWFEKNTFAEIIEDLKGLK